MEHTYKNIVAHYEQCLEKFGDSCQGVDWPNEKDAQTRYKVMTELFNFNAGNDISLLDFGCGTAHLLEYINTQSFSGQIQYAGLDISSKYIEVARDKFPGTHFIQMDVLEEGEVPGYFDYIIMNGVFTEKQQLSFDEMWNYVQAMLVKIFPLAGKGLAFNVMSKQVDWERKDLSPSNGLIGFIPDEKNFPKFCFSK